MNHSLTVVNVKHVKPGTFVYCGRYNSTYKLAASPLANPFKLEVDTDGERMKVLSEYRAWLVTQLETDTAARREVERIATMLEKQDVALGCWCFPLKCHCDVIAAFVRRCYAGRAAQAAIAQSLVLQKAGKLAPIVKQRVAGIEIETEKKGK